MNNRIPLLVLILILCSQLIAQNNYTNLTGLKKLAEKEYYAGNYSKASELFLQVAEKTRLAADYYNAACTFSLDEKTEKAFDMLNKAIKAGYKNYSNLLRDQDLDNIRNDDRYKQLIKNMSRFDKVVESTTEPEKAKIIYEDVHNFINAYKLLQSSSDTIKILEKEYFGKATAGLKIFIEKYGLTAEQLAKRIKQYPQDYSAIEAKLEWLKSREQILRKYFKKVKVFIPDAIFPPTYYLIDSRRGYASGSIEGQLVSIEKQAVDTIDVGIEGTIVHELVHLNQLNTIGSLDKYLAIYNREKSLLAICIREGVATFFAELITGEGKTQQRRYLDKYEMEVWRRFETDMFGKDTKDWVFRKPDYSDQPRDLGYVIGEKIVEYYYKHSLDLDVAVKEILSITDYKEFLEKSNYLDKFK